MSLIPPKKAFITAESQANQAVYDLYIKLVELTTQYQGSAVYPGYRDLVSQEDLDEKVEYVETGLTIDHLAQNQQAFVAIKEAIEASLPSIVFMKGLKAE